MWRESLSPDGLRKVARGESGEPLTIQNVRTGMPICTLKGLMASTTQSRADYSVRGDLILGSNYRGEKELYFWTRRRPEPWWGLAWLPESWLTLLFAALLGWSLYRDVKDFKRTGRAVFD